MTIDQQIELYWFVDSWSLVCNVDHADLWSTNQIVLTVHPSDPFDDWYANDNCGDHCHIVLSIDLQN